ncbi:MAG TPA: O-antigen ligase family protein [Candidatus Parcubacteria bacterium]|nr:O-antigen ligase family protein [Candidatus Parcubacteria bacterium]
MGKQSQEKWDRREYEETAWIENKGLYSWLEKACLFIIQWGTYLVLFASLLVLRSSYFPFVTPKTIFFNAIVEIILAAYLILVISYPRYRPKLNLLSIAILIFLGVLVLTSVFGINFSRSFWSTHERMTGLFTMLHLTAFFFILTSTFKKREDWEKILGASIIAGVLLSLYVLFSDQISSRGGGTIGNTSFMAAYLLFNVFFALIIFLSKKNLGWQVFSGVSLLVLVPTLLTSGGRGAIFSFYVGLALLVLGYLAFSRSQTLKRIALGLVLTTVIFGVTAFVLQPDFLTTKTNSLMHEMKPRFTVWGIALKAFQEKPLLGWGPENFHVPFSKHFNPCLFIGECGGEIWFDRAHNIVFDTAASSGVLGLLSYLSIFSVAIFGLLRAAKKVENLRNIFLPLGMTSLLIIYFIQNGLVFDMINSYLVFFLSLGFVSFLAFNNKREESDDKRVKPVHPLLLMMIIVVMGGIFWLGNINQAQSGVAIVNVVNPQNNIEESTIYFKESLNYFMEKYETREHFTRKVSQLIFSGGGEDREALVTALELAEEEMVKSTEENPLDFRTHLFLGKLYSNSYQISGSREKLELAEKILERAIELGPTNQQGYWYLGEIRFAQGRNEEGINLFQKAVDLEPRFGQSHWFLAMAYQING